ncbi:SpoIIE family protein phosphatase [Streptomyces antibioticus]|uniref:SpoIIE family protein phosphatase n=1 Tax=Streptomyces antibioticus TaxID=1890 RepID=UPI002252C605|nr:SpoIIE family protein phosphatase [Streptomyces antibioticus]MCX4741341.1 SpoIIE family protein phosphatase [Streptomyces antibioticus]
MTSADDPGPRDAPPDAALADTVRGTGASVGALYLLTPDERVLRLSLLCGASAEVAAPWATVAVNASAPVAAAVRQERLVWVAGRDELVRAYPRSAMTLPYPLSLAAAPVTGARRWGALLLLWPTDSRPPHMTARERANIMAGCRRLARLLEDADRPADGPGRGAGPPRVVPVATGGRPASPAAAAADFAERLPGGSCALDLEGRFTYLSSGACALLGRDAGHLLGTLPWHSLRWLDDPVYEDRYRAALLSRQPVTFTACRPPDRWLDFHLYPDASGISVRVTPTGTPEPAPPVPQRAVWPAGVGRLYQLVHLAAGLTEVVGVQDVIDLVADQIMPAFGAQGLVLSAAEGGRLRITGTRGYPPVTVSRLDGLPVDTTLTPAGQALSSGVPAFFGDPEELRRAYPEAQRISDKHAWAFLPLIVSGRPVGCCILSYDRPHTFTAGDRAVLTSLAGLVAQAMDRARLYDAKHALAHTLQAALLPRTLPAVPGLRVAARYLPATRGMDIGGDFYDLIPLGDGAVAAVIGDVQGHNAAAAALMGQVSTAVHAYAARGADPDEVLSATNRLLADFGPELFTSCLYAHFDLASGRAALASAGHPPPLVQRDGSAQPLDVVPGPLLGVDPDASFPVTDVALGPGHTLAFYTDGLVETPGADIEEAIAALAVELGRAGPRAPDLLIDHLLGHSPAAGRRADDIALLVLRYAPDEQVS